MKRTKLVGFLVLVLGVTFVSTKADDLSNPAVFSTNAGYASFAGYAHISADGTNALAQLATEVSRSTSYDTNLLAQLVTETNRAYAYDTNLMTQLVTETNRAYNYDTNLNARLDTETNRAYTYDTNLLAQLVTETNRSYTYDTNLLAQLVTETNRSYNYDTNLTAQLITETNRSYAYYTNLTALLDIETNRAQIAEEILSTNKATYAQGLLASSAYQPNGTNLLTEGFFDIVDTTQLVFIAGAVTNIIDADITQDAITQQ